MILPTDYNPNKFVSKAGQRYKPEYIGEENEEGFIELVKVGETDLVQLHQRDALANDVNVLYERFCNGDITALSQVQGSFMDTLGLPRDLRGMYEMVSNFETAYDNLPAEIKQKYTKEEFIEKAGSEEWIRDLQPRKSSSPTTDTAPDAPPAE